ncbi:MAG: NAD(P)H-binding protein [Ignavibacteria bacterium]
MFGSSVEIIEGDLFEVKDLKNLLNGVTHLFTAHGADNESNPRGYELIDFGGMKKVLEGFPEGQDTHIVYMSSIYLERKNPPPDYPGRPLYWKRKTEHLVRQSHVIYTIVRASWLNNNRGGKMLIKAEQGDQGDGKITREDVAEVWCRQ